MHDGPGIVGGREVVTGQPVRSKQREGERAGEGEKEGGREGGVRRGERKWGEGGGREGGGGGDIWDTTTCYIMLIMHYNTVIIGNLWTLWQDLWSLKYFMIIMPKNYEHIKNHIKIISNLSLYWY